VTAALLLLRKDLLVLRRSRALLVILLAYPLVIAVLIGLIAGYANTKPRVAFVDEDHLPDRVTLAGQVFYPQRVIDRVAKNVRLIEMSREDARRALDSGRVAGVLTIPSGFLKTLETFVQSPTIYLQTGTGALAARIEQQAQALVYNLNGILQESFIKADEGYVALLLHGGKGEVLGRRFDVLGLDGMKRILARLPHTPELDALREFGDDATKALGLTGVAIRAAATPIQLERVPDRGRTWILSAQVQAYGLALTISFLALLLAAGSIAAERDENVIGRLARGLVRLGQLVWAKVALAATVALVLGLAVAITFGIVVEAGSVVGGEPWERLPLVVVGLLLAGGSLGAFGALIGGLAREARAASLAAILVVLPLVFLGLVPHEVLPEAGWVSDAFPFSHAVRFFASALFDVSPWTTLLKEGAWLLGLGAVYGLLARVAAKRLLT
jgi:hypothetical protein